MDASTAAEAPKLRTVPPPEPTTPRWINRTVIGIGLASLFSDVGHEMATAAMPALLASIGSSSLWLGLVEGVSDGASSIAKLYAGLYSDQLRRRKPLAVLGYFLTGGGMASFAVATRGWHVLVGRLVGWLGRGVRTPVRNVLLTEATTPATYGRAFGLERAMDSAGAVIGPLLALTILYHFGLRSVFAYALVPALVAAVAFATLVRERPHEPPPRTTLLVGTRALPRSFRRFLFGVGIAGLGDFSKTLLILWATQAWTSRFGAARAAAIAMIFYVGYNVVYTLSCYLSGALADRVPKRRLLATGYALAVIPALALLVPGTSFLKFAIAFGVSGLYMGLWETVEGSTAAGFLPARLRGLGFGTLATVNGIGDLASSVAIGGLWALSHAAAMSMVIATSLVGALIIARSRADRGPTGEEMTQPESTQPPLSLTVFGTTETGKVREGNEDAFVICAVEAGTPLTSTEPLVLSTTSPGVLLMVCDGLGGAAAGEVASKLACDTVSRSLYEQRGAAAGPDLMAAMRAANQAIFEESWRRSDERGMGTTCTMALVREERLTVAQVGDSRAYLARGGKLRQLTRDQSLAMALLDAGTLSPSDLKEFPHGNVILQALGVQETVDPVKSELDLESGDVILLCSDGLHAPVGEDRISSIMLRDEPLAVRAQSLIGAALDVGAPDNVTVVLAMFNRR